MLTIAPHRSTIQFVSAAAALLVLALMSLAGCDGHTVSGQPGAPGSKKGGPGAPAKRPVLVVAASVLRKDVPIIIQQPNATVEPVATVTVRARIGGQLDKVHFREGQEVKKDDLLFTIDRRPLEAELRQAEANLERDRAQAANALADSQRYARLIERGAVATAEYDKIRTTYKALQAVAAAEQAAVENARLQIAYTEIRAPIGGLTGGLKIDQGNLVKANDTDLVTINQLSPIYVSFSVDEDRLPEIQRAMTARTLAVLAAIPNDPVPERGTLTFINNTVTAGTGQIQLSGTFANDDRRLWPGLFVGVTLELGTESGAIVVPSAAIQTDQDGTFVFVIRPNMTVEQRPVEVEREFGGELAKAGQRAKEGEMIVTKGLAPGERVVTEGHLQLVADSPVEIKGESRRPARAAAPTTATAARTPIAAGPRP